MSKPHWSCAPSSPAEDWPECSYCGVASTANYQSGDVYMCLKHYQMWIEGDMSLELIRLIIEAEENAI